MQRERDVVDEEVSFYNSFGACVMCGFFSRGLISLIIDSDKVCISCGIMYDELVYGTLYSHRLCLSRARELHTKTIHYDTYTCLCSMTWVPANCQGNLTKK